MTKIAASNLIERSCHFTWNLFNFSDFILNFRLFPSKFIFKNKNYTYKRLILRNKTNGIQQPRNLRQLREAIISACESLPLDQQMIQKAFDDMISRAQRCIQAQRHALPGE